MAHLHIVIGVQMHFKLKFSPEEITNLQNVGDIVNLVEQKLA